MWWLQIQNSQVIITQYFVTLHVEYSVASCCALICVRKREREIDIQLSFLLSISVSKYGKKLKHFRCVYFEICLLISSISMYTQLYMKKQSLVERVESVSVFSESHDCSVALSLFTCVHTYYVQKDQGIYRMFCCLIQSFGFGFF